MPEGDGYGDEELDSHLPDAHGDGVLDHLAEKRPQGTDGDLRPTTWRLARDHKDDPQFARVAEAWRRRRRGK